MTAKNKLKKHADKARFASAGVLNMLLDFGIFNILSLAFNVPSIIANTISTGFVIVQSFLLNKKYVFKKQSKKYMREVVLFIFFTVIGLWVINNSAVQIILGLLPDWDKFWRINIAKVLAAMVSGVWHYLTYKYVVFRKN